MERELTCREMIEFLDDYLAGDQAADIRAEFERHLSICPACVDYLKAYQAAIRLAAASGEPDAPATALTVAPEELIRAILAAREKDA